MKAVVVRERETQRHIVTRFRGQFGLGF